MNTPPHVDLLELVTGATSQDLEPGASIIVLHGLGADGSDFLPVAQAMDLSPVGPVRYVFPSAPVRPVTINGGYAMRAWYDIHPPADEPGGVRQEDELGLRESQAIVERLIERERQRGVPAERIVLMGFSQGCAMTLLAGLRSPHRLAGLVALSGYLPLAPTTATEATPVSREIPVLMIHGLHDEVVVPARGEAARDVLKDLGYNVQWATFAMGHELCMEEVSVIRDWLLERLQVPRT